MSLSENMSHFAPRSFCCTGSCVVFAVRIKLENAKKCLALQMALHSVKINEKISVKPNLVGTVAVCRK